MLRSSIFYSDDVIMIFYFQFTFFICFFTNPTFSGSLKLFMILLVIPRELLNSVSVTLEQYSLSFIISFKNLPITLSDKIYLKRREVTLWNLSIYSTWKKVKTSCKNRDFKTSVPTWNDKFELPDESYSVSDIQDYFKYFIKKHEAVTDNPPIRIYVRK